LDRAISPAERPKLFLPLSRPEEGLVPRSKIVTQLLRDWRQGDQAALNQLMPVVYEELRRLGASWLRRERPGHTLQPTALIHEAYLRLIDQDPPEWESRTHFFGIASRLMRQILIEHARRRATAKRGGEQEKVSLDEALVYGPERASQLVALDEALSGLAAIDERKCRIVEMRYFGGLTTEEIAQQMNISVATVGREVRVAEAWLNREMGQKSK
jgi:RNA polymerase sigma-70 factor, ECF subfamily